MNSLPKWLKDVKETIPKWVERVSHSDGPGRARFAIDAYEPYDMDSSSLLRDIVYTIGSPLPDEDQRRQWVDYLLSLQRSEDGLLIDAGMERHIICEGDEPTAEEIANVRRFTSRNGLDVVVMLGGRPRYALKHNEAFHEPAEMVEYLQGLDWHLPWGAGSWAGAVIKFQHFNRLVGNESADGIIRAGIDWLTKKQDPQTGAWSDGSDVELHHLINGIFKIWIQILPIADLPVQYPEQVVDLCIKAMQQDPALGEHADACSVFDVAMVLDIALRHTDHRKDEVAQFCAAFIPKLEPMVRSDGAFSYGAEHSLLNHGGLALAPVKEQSDILGTALHCNALALLCNLCGLRQELGWTPTTEWRTLVK